MDELERSKETASISVSPALDLVLDSADVPLPTALVDKRTLLLCAIAIGLGLAMTGVAALLIKLIFFFTNFFFFGRISLADVSPAGNALGFVVVFVPVVGALIVGFMARYGSKAIRGHGIPEAMEQVLLHQSRIPARITFLKPLSAAIAIGTGGPFGAEGPIIATGGALGSLVGQVMRTSAIERKTLLAAGAAAGMSATFGSPVSAVLLAIELLLFEYRARSVIPVALASAAAAGLRIWMVGHEPIFPLPALRDPTLWALSFYILLGLLVGFVAVGITRLLYAVEDAFERLPVHWMWWPAVGAVAVGMVGYYFPRTLGVGYENIADALAGRLVVSAALGLALMKLVSWSIALGSGTSGGTLAPLLTIGGCLGMGLGSATASAWPAAGIDLRVAALVGMAAMFASASRALLASVVFAFETTLQPLGLLPLLGGCAAAYLMSCFWMRNSLMTEKIARRGVNASGEYEADLLGQLLVTTASSQRLVALDAERSVADVRAWIAEGADGARHQGFPVLDERGTLVGVITRRDLLESDASGSTTVRSLIKRSPKFVYDDCTLRQAAGHMVSHDIGRLPVVARANGRTVLGMLTRSDILRAYRRSLEEQKLAKPTIELPFRRKAARI